MRIAVHNNAHLAEQGAWMAALVSGFQRHGHEVTLYDDPFPVDCDLAVFWSHKKHQIIANQKAKGLDYLVIERGYLGERMTNHCSLGFNGLNGRADFQNQNVPDDRGKMWRHLLEPYHDGKYTVIMGQVPGDAALTCNLQEFVSEAQQGATHHGKPIVFRPHPVAKGYPVPGVMAVHGTLEHCLHGAHWAITYSSNSGVDAALAGVRVTALDQGSMAWDIAAHDYTPTRPTDAERVEWLNWLAYCQWTIDEIRNGDAWAHLKQRYD